jgi:hypothetical protein
MSDAYNPQAVEKKWQTKWEESGLYRQVIDKSKPKHYPRYQRHAEDLMAKATQVQLLADPPPQMVALSSLAINTKGVLAFALAGVVCVTDTEQMNMLPQT